LKTNKKMKVTTRELHRDAYLGFGRDRAVDCGAFLHIATQ
jgi:hypothetical protein